MPRKEPTKEARIAKLKQARKTALQTPSGAEGKAAKDARMKKIKEYDAAIKSLGGKIEPIGEASTSAFRDSDYNKIKGKVGSM